MTPYKNYRQNGSWRHQIRRGAFYIAVGTILAANIGCGNNNENGQDWEEVTVQEPTKGVITTLEETAAGEFSVTNEEVVATRDESRVIIKRLDGTTDNLTLAQAQALVQPGDTTQASYHHRSHGMGNVIWWGAMGYMMGRSFSSPVNPGIYRDTRGGTSGGGYAGGSSYMRGTQAASELQRTSVSRTVMRPVSGRSGFFGGSSRGRSGG